MFSYAPPLARLIEELSKLPTVGPKTAQRLAFHLLSMSQQDAEALATAILDAKSRIRHCSICGNITEADPCAICTSPQRDQSVICVVEDPRDVAAMERIREFTGLYHVLRGAISPLDGIGPDDLRIAELLQRVAPSGGQAPSGPAPLPPYLPLAGTGRPGATGGDRGGAPTGHRQAGGAVREVIVATNPRVEGEATALYLSKVLKPLGVRVTRIAHGLPVGGDLEYADEVTLARALEGRRDL